MCVDQCSGYPLYQKMNSTTSSSIVKMLTGRFNALGWPTVIRWDGGPQFHSEFMQFCDENSITHELSSPYNQRANGVSGVRFTHVLTRRVAGV